MITVNGKEYELVPADSGGGCRGCVADTTGDNVLCRSLPDCCDPYNGVFKEVPCDPT